MIDSKLQEELKKKYNPDGSVLRRAQLRMTEMLVFLDKVCTKYNLRYWLDSGTLLGAARHGGFIPWDDDTDVCMPMEDLRKLKKIMATEHLSDEFVLQTPENDKNYLRIEWCTLRDLKSEYVHEEYEICKVDKELKYRGLQVDLFPMATGVNLNIKKLFNKLQNMMISKWLYKSNIPFPVGIVLAKAGRNLLEAIIKPLLEKYQDPGTKDCYMATYGCPLVTRRYVKNIYPLRRISFEGHTFNAPNNPNAYLTDLYGDWNKIPEAEAIETHKAEIKFFDKPQCF